MEPFYIYRRDLPHWRLQAATYFVTWSLPSGAKPLIPEEKTIVLNTLRFFHGQRFDLLEHVVMDDHVHLLTCPKSGHPLSKIIHSWKSFSAHEMQRLHGRRGAVWQREFYDRIIRSERDEIEKAKYVLSNPFQANPELREYAWLGTRDWASRRHEGLVREVGCASAEAGPTQMGGVR